MLHVYIGSSKRDLISQRNNQFSVFLWLIRSGLLDPTYTCSIFVCGPLLILFYFMYTLSLLHTLRRTLVWIERIHKENKGRRVIYSPE